MEGKSLAFVAVLVIVSLALISQTHCAPALDKREMPSILSGNAVTIAKSIDAKQRRKHQRQGRFYNMGYPHRGGLGYGGATVTASASASASSGGIGMGYRGYPYMYGR